MSTKTVPTVYHRQKQSKDSQTAKKWPLVYQSSHVYAESAEYTKPRKRRYLSRPPSHVPGQWPQPVARGQGWLYVSTWTFMRLAPVRCRVLLHSLLPTDDASSSSSLSTTVIKFSIFWTPLANFLLSRPNSVEYGNFKTTTLLPSAKCTRPLFQGRTGCGGRPSGWRHDIITCQRLVWTLMIMRCHKCETNWQSKRIRVHKLHCRSESAVCTFPLPPSAAWSKQHEPAYN